MSAKEEFVKAIGDVALATKLETLEAINIVFKELLATEVTTDSSGKTVRVLSALEVLSAFTMTIDKIIEKERKQLHNDK